MTTTNFKWSRCSWGTNGPKTMGDRFHKWGETEDSKSHQPSPEYDMWFSMSRPSVLSVALQDSMRTPQTLPDYTVAVSDCNQWRNTRDKRKRIRDDNNAILSGRAYVRDFFKDAECIAKLERVWNEVDADPSISLDYRRLISPRTGGPNE